MFNIDECKDYIAWVEYSEDEKYQIKYMYPESRTAEEGEWAQTVVDHLLDWEGVIDTDGNKVEPNDENKLTVLGGKGIESQKRMFWLVRKMADEKVFFDLEEHLKNL